MTEPRKEQRPFWVRRSKTRRRKDFDEIMDAAAERLKATPAACQLIGEYRRSERLPHIQERILLHRYRVMGDQEAYEELVKSLLAIPLRPAALEGANDEFFEDVVQEGLVYMMDYLEHLDIGSKSQWMTLISLVPRNARVDLLYSSIPPVILPKIREMKGPVRTLALLGRDRIHELDQADLEDLFPDADASAVEAAHAGLLSECLESAPEPSFDPTPGNDLAIDLSKLMDWAQRTLPAREWKILSLRYLSDREWSLDDVGKAVGVTAERVRQIERDLLKKLAKAYDQDLNVAPEPQKNRGRSRSAGVATSAEAAATSAPADTGYAASSSQNLPLQFAAE